MHKSAVEKFAKYARTHLMERVVQKAAFYGVSPNKTWMVESESTDAIVIHGAVHDVKIKSQREALVREVKSKGFEQVVEEVAYTWFNRFCALRYMEVNDYLPTGLRALSSTDPGKTEPDILTHCLEVDLPFDKAELHRLMDAHDDEELYKRLLIAQCNALNEPLPFLFEKINDYTELLCPDGLLVPDSIIHRLVEDVPEEDWREIEIVGWLYQFYISEKKDEVIGKVVNKEDIPAATQLFTPKWIVQYMVENSLGRLWLEMHPDSPLREKMQYYIENPDDKDIRREPMPPEEITCMDDACGSGHILVYMFDLLYSIYEEMGYVSRDIPSLVLKHNLNGIDIDKRAVQLASFAVMMKARSKDRRFFTRGVLPRVVEIRESNGIDIGFLLKMDKKQFDAFRRKFGQRDMFEQGEADDLFDWASEKTEEDAPPPWMAHLQGLVDLFHDAKNYGSLLTVPEGLARSLPEIHGLLEHIADEDELFGGMGVLLRDLVVQAEVLAGKYDVCVANPPYMGGKGMNLALKNFAKRQYPNSKSDLFAMFIERNNRFAKSSGFNAIITMNSWMFLSSFENLRESLLARTDLGTMAHFGPNAFDSIGGHVVQTTAFVLSQHRHEEISNTRKGVFIRLVDGGNETEKRTALLEAIQNPDCGWFFRASSEDFKKIPGSPIAYAMSERLRQAFALGQALHEIAKPLKGFDTGGDGERYFRKWYEIDISGFTTGGTGANRWVESNKGGEFRKWYGNRESVVVFGESGRCLYDIPGANIRNRHAYFKEGLTYTVISYARTAFRWSSRDAIFYQHGATCPVEDSERLLALAGFLNSHVARRLLAELCPTLSFTVNDVAKIPIHKEYLSVRPAVESMMRIASRDWDSYETSWDFEAHPLLTNPAMGKGLAASWDALSDCIRATILQMQEMETENNRLWVAAYGLQGEISPETPLDEITLTCNPEFRFSDTSKKILASGERWALMLSSTVKELLVYAIGCMMGRYSIDAPGLVFAGGDWNERWMTYKTRRDEMEERRQRDVANKELLAREEPYEIPEGCETWQHSPSFPEDDDGIIPLLDEDYFEDDGVNRIIEFLKVTFPEEGLTENLQFLADNLTKPKKGESPPDTIRRYLATTFFKDHCKTYKKRPIYWLFTSGKQRAFQAIIYMHRYTPSMLSTMRTDYLHELQGKIEIQSKHLSQVAESGTPTEQRDAQKQLSRIRKKQDELRKYDERLRHHADQRIEIDLDDGVKVNYLKFEGLVETIPGLKKKKK